MSLPLSCVIAALAGFGCGGNTEVVVEPMPSAPMYCPLRGGDRIDTRTLLGLPVDEATRRTAAHGCEVAVETEDGGDPDQLIPDDGRPDRVRVEVNEDTITRLVGVG